MWSDEALEKLNEPKYEYQGEKFTDYEAQQKERYFDRQIQRWRREEVAMKAAGFDNLEAKAKVREWRARKKDFLSNRITLGIDNRNGHDIIKAGNGTLDRKERNIGVFSVLEIPMQKRYVVRIAQKHKIDLSGIIIKIQRDPAWLRSTVTGRADQKQIGRIDFMPNAFKDEESLLRTIIHEKVHVTQLLEHGADYVADHLAEMEDLAYAIEDEWIAKNWKGG